MLHYYGFDCKQCDEIIALGKLNPKDDNRPTFYTAPLDPIICPACGGSYQYGSDDLFGFEAEENISQFPGRTRLSSAKRRQPRRA